VGGQRTESFDEVCALALKSVVPSSPSVGTLVPASPRWFIHQLGRPKSHRAFTSRFSLCSLIRRRWTVTVARLAPLPHEMVTLLAPTSPLNPPLTSKAAERFNFRYSRSLFFEDPALSRLRRVPWVFWRGAMPCGSPLVLVTTSSPLSPEQLSGRISSSPRKNMPFSFFTE